MTEFRASGGAPRAVLARVILQCYYRDDRVLHSLGIEPRAPFPKGHVLPDGDWSILDPVKARAEACGVPRPLHISASNLPGARQPDAKA